MATRSTTRTSSTRITQNRRQPSILRRKRKINHETQRILANIPENNSTFDVSPGSKCLNETSQDSSPAIQNASSPSSVIIASSSSSSLCPLPSSSVGVSCSEGDDQSSSLSEENALSSPAAPRPFRSLTCYSSPLCGKMRNSPLPQLNWADHKELWETMLQKDSAYPRNPKLLLRHPQLQPRMRAILLEWIMEVCEVYKLHRETYYLAQDFIDRYLTFQKGLPKQQLQLLGITCLFLAAKIEEIYPPKLSEFSYVTDNACSETEIIEKELVVLKVLNWDLTPVTVNAWLLVYLQLASSDGGQCFLLPDYPGIVLVKVAQLLDLCLLDVNALRFLYGIIAAAALYHTTNSTDIVLSCTGFEWSELVDCVEWMKPFAQTIQEEAKEADVATFKNVLPEDQHNIQTKTVDLQLLEKALTRKAKTTTHRVAPIPQDVLTPPKSAKKTRTSPQTC